MFCLMARFLFAVWPLALQGHIVGGQQAPFSCQAGGNCGAEDDAMLFQTSRASSSQAALALNQHRASSSAMLTKIEDMTAKVISGEEKITDATRLALESIDIQMDSIMSDAMKEQKAFQGTVDRASVSVQDCGARFKKALHSGTNTTASIDSIETSVSDARVAHSNCRKQEVATKEDDSGKCGALDTYVKDLQGDVGGSNPAALLQVGVGAKTQQQAMSSCMCVKPADLGQEAFKHCVEKMSEWSATASNAWSAREAACTQSTEAFDEQRASCKTLQGQFESDVCTFDTALRWACSEQSSCRESAMKLQSDSNSNVAIAEGGFKAEYESAKHVKCIVQVLNATDGDMPTMLAACKAATYDTPNLTITYHPVPDAEPCNLETKVATKPCHDDFQATEYTSQAWNLSAPVHACTPCDGPIPATVAAPTITTAATQEATAAPTTALVTQAPTTAAAAEAKYIQVQTEGAQCPTGYSQVTDQNKCKGEAFAALNAEGSLKIVHSSYTGTWADHVPGCFEGYGSWNGGTGNGNLHFGTNSASTGTRGYRICEKS